MKLVICGTLISVLNKIKIYLTDWRWTLSLGLSLSAIFALFEAGNYLISWLSTALIFFLGLCALLALWRWSGKTQMLLLIIALALLLRLVSAIVLQVFLPINGYQESEQQQAGYVFFDAFRRDTQAWDLAQSEASLFTAFNKEYHTDQYGGLLAFSAGSYRYLSPDAHRPLLIALLAAFAATFGIPFFWMAAKEIGGEKLAFSATWLFALYPESILQGSSQMREPFLISFVALTLWAFLTWQIDRQHRFAQWGLGIGFTGLLLISPAIAIINLIILSIYAAIQHERNIISSKQIIIIIAIFLFAIFLLSAGLSQKNFASNTPIGVILEWLHKAIKWDAYQLEVGSGWVQKLYKGMPAAFHIPFATGYGLAQPVLPAALIEPTTPIWKTIAILRALGWYLLAPFLLYGFIAIPKLDSPQARRIWTWVGLASWTWIILASLRAGGDQWDNPRYRVIFLTLQALFAARAWLSYRERRDAWFPRILAVEVIFLAFFTHWYASRYYVRFATLSFGAMVVWILSLSALLLFGGLFWDNWQSQKNKSA